MNLLLFLIIFGAVVFFIGLILLYIEYKQGLEKIKNGQEPDNVFTRED